GEAGFLRQLLDGFGKGQSAAAHDEADHIAMGAAAEAVEEALLVVDGEGRGLLVAERAEAGEFPPALDQPHGPAHNARQWQPVAQFLKEGIGKCHHASPAAAPGPISSAGLSGSPPPWRSPSGRHISPSARPWPCPYH